MINVKKTVRHTIHLMICTFTLIAPFNSLQAKTLEPISGRSIDVEIILPADVLARAHLLFDEIELIRLELGKPKEHNALEPVLDASPREVYFQALTSFIKANRLLYEQTGDRDAIPSAINVKSIKPFHVWQMVNKSYEQILKVKNSLHINEQIIEKEYTIDTSPSDVFSQVVLTHKQLNALLKKQFYPSDSYQKINESIHLMAALLATVPSIKRIPLPEAFERRKTPSDVYAYLIKTRSILTKILNSSDIKFVHLKQDDKGIKGASDVYDLASLLVADLHYVHSLKLTASSPAKTYLVGNKTPSDVYQRVSILNQQLQTLQKLHQIQPNWLSQ